MKKVFGVGINDADYFVRRWKIVGRDSEGKAKTALEWGCPFYTKWKHMLERCYSPKLKLKRPTYNDCYAVENWHLFSNFKAWMETQDWEGKQLDKDLLVYGNKLYGPETCCFLTSRVNLFLTESKSSRGEWPIGVHWNTKIKRFGAKCSDPFTGKILHIGYFDSSAEAFMAWLEKKTEYAYKLADLESDERVANAIISRYVNYLKDPFFS